MAKKTRSKTSKKVEPVLSKELQCAFAHFLQCYPPKFFSRNLRNMVVELVTYQKGCYPDYLNPLLMAMEMFFDLLDKAEDESPPKSSGH